MITYGFESELSVIEASAADRLGKVLAPDVAIHRTRAGAAAFMGAVEATMSMMTCIFLASSLP